MSVLGIHLSLLIGPTVALPAPPQLLEALQSLEVTHSDEGRSGFQMTFQVGRGDLASLLDYSLLTSQLLRPFNRVIMIVTFNALPRVLMDGIITHQQLATSTEPGASTLTVTGEDVSVMMDLEEKSAEHPAQSDAIVAEMIILKYARYGLIPNIIPTPTDEPPLPVERIPVQQGTDLQHLETLAARHAYVFYIIPGPVPYSNTAYWGPPQRLGLPQRALSVNMGGDSNVSSINFQYNALIPTLVTGSIQDRETNAVIPVDTLVSMRPPLSSQPAWLVNQPNVRTTQFRSSGLNTVQALAAAQAITDSADATVTATGDLDALSYGDILQARGLVGLRGAGYTNDGLYYVKSVTHTLTQGSYRQQFTLTREGQGAITPVVRP